MANVLVVANDTHGGYSLIEAIRERSDQGDARFVVIAPQMVNFAGPASLAGRYVEVEVVHAHPHSLRGRLASTVSPQSGSTVLQEPA